MKAKYNAIASKTGLVSPTPKWTRTTALAKIMLSSRLAKIMIFAKADAIERAAFARAERILSFPI